MGKFAEQENEQKKKAKSTPPAQQQTVQRDLSDVNGPEGGMLPGDVSAKIQAKRGTGQKLSERQNQFFSQKFGRDMSDVHVHTDSESDTISRSLNARAFTIGSDVFLSKGINPDAGAGRDAQTMTHELTHVVQQGGHASSGPLKLGAADTAQEHEAESTAMRELDPKLVGEDDTIQRGFWSDLGTAIAGSALNAIGLGDAVGDFMGGDKKVKAAIEKMSEAQKNNYSDIEGNIKQLDDTNIPNKEKEIKGLQKSINKIQGDPTKTAELNQRRTELTDAQNDLRGYKSDLDNNLKQQLSMLQSVDATITTDDVNRYRSGKAKTFFSSVFSAIGGNILGAFESDPEKKAAAKAKGRKSVNNWFASANKTSLAEETEEQKANKAEEMEQKQRGLIDAMWNEVSADQTLNKVYTKLLFKREIAANYKQMIQESIKEGESDNDIKASVMMMLRNKAESAQANRAPVQQPNA